MKNFISLCALSRLNLSLHLSFKNSLSSGDTSNPFGPKIFFMTLLTRIDSFLSFSFANFACNFASCIISALLPTTLNDWAARRSTSCSILLRLSSALGLHSTTTWAMLRQYPYCFSVPLRHLGLTLISRKSNKKQCPPALSYMHPLEPR
nr:hypothetical protein [Crucivirus sp.]